MKKILLCILFLSCACTISAAKTEKELFEDGVRYYKQHRFSMAAESFTKLIKMSPKNADAHKNRGVTFMQLKKYDAAIKDFETAKKLFPKLKGLYSNLGVAWYFKKEYGKAIESYNMEIAMDPDQHVAYFNRALCLAGLGKNKKALQDLAQTLELKPDFYDAICYKADIQAQMGDNDNAVETYQEAIRLDPSQSYPVEKLAKLKKRIQKQRRPAEPAVPKEKTVSTTTAQNREPSQSTPKNSAPEGAAQNNSREIQVGAFLSKDNAEKMKKRLIKSGFDSRILVREDKKKRTWYLVRSGSYPDKQSAQKDITQLKQKFKVSPVVRPHDDW